MPEGDTIYRSARVLARAVGGKIILGARSPLPELRDASLEGRRIVEVTSLGKNLLMRLDDGRTIASHMRMTGSWHIYRPGEAWQKPEQNARLVLETDGMIAVCFSAPVVRLLPAGGERRDPSLAGLGPDLMRDDFDREAALARLAALRDVPVGVALLDQRALAGIGNIWKNEVLFLCRTSPFVAVGELPEGTLGRLVDEARARMLENRVRSRRITRRALTGPDLWVSGRAGRPCLVCGARVLRRPQGEAGRVTHYCPRCQAA